MSYSWHWEWKSFFPVNCREIRIGGHQADVKIGDTILEFQHSRLTDDELADRELFYGKMIWIFDARASDIEWKAVESLQRDRFYVEWKTWRSEPWQRARKPMILHLGGWDLIWVHQSDQICGFGNGFYVQRPILIDRFKSANFEQPLNNLYARIKLCT